MSSLPSRTPQLVKTKIKKQAAGVPQTQHVESIANLRGEENLSGFSLSSFSRARSESGPKRTIGRTKPIFITLTMQRHSVSKLMKVFQKQSNWHAGVKLTLPSDLERLEFLRLLKKPLRDSDWVCSFLAALN
ncbi:hypothetical protein E2C01_022888 [Portunus trituberculatus]|uniref:Uncharacterized protein n=1 Tax=Portunus trituberculatus TaxID=210409 RepID=A0A5B7EA38_PORTR|nr:hypothetical protein [Portunus trituberculatus]